MVKREILYENPEMRIVIIAKGTDDEMLHFEKVMGYDSMMKANYELFMSINKYPLKSEEARGNAFYEVMFNSFHYKGNTKENPHTDFRWLYNLLLQDILLIGKTFFPKQEE